MKVPRLRLLMLCGLVSAACLRAAPLEPRFRPLVVDTNIVIGYGVTTADVNGDGRPDIVLCDARQVAWYESPGWTKHVIAENLTPLDHVCVAAADIDGDGKAEISVGAGWNPGDTLGSGALFHLVAPEDRTRPWRPVTLPHDPTMHRIRWARHPDKGWVLVSVPLHGRGNKDAKGEGVKIRRHIPPATPGGPWTSETMDDSLHKTHNFDLVRDAGEPGLPMLVGASEGAFELARPPDGTRWTRQRIADDTAGGIGEIRQARGFVAAISPMHGNQLVVLTPPPPGGPADALYRRAVIDEGLVDGHALACGDLLGTGTDQIVAGWRAMNRPPGTRVGVALYFAVGGRWMKWLVDDNGMACEDLCLADLDGDGRLDIVASGRATKNVKIYFNETPR